MTDDRDTYKPKHRPKSEPSSAAPGESWDGPNSDVHVVPVQVPGESQLATIERVARETRSIASATGQGTLETLAHHDKAIKELTGRMGAVEGGLADVKTLNEQQNGKLDLNNAKLGGVETAMIAMATAVKALAAPSHVEELVAREVRLTTTTAQHDEAKDRRAYKLERLKTAGGIITALVASGFLGALLTRASC